MFTLTIPGGEFWNETTEEFIHTKEQNLSLEHSLVSLAKWESRWNVPFLDKKPLSFERTVDYIRCMTLTQNVDPKVYDCITQKHVKAVKAYMDLPMTAATFKIRKNTSGSNEAITAETFYYWMISYEIPIEMCQKWHLNRLIALIRFCSIKNNPGPKMSRREILSDYAAINAARRKK